MTDPWIDLVMTLAAALAAAVALSLAARGAMALVARRAPAGAQLSARARRPFQLLLVAVATWSSMTHALPVEPVRGGVPTAAADSIEIVLRATTIVAVAWLVAAVVLFAEERGLARHRLDVVDNRHARRVRTQMLIIRRLTVGLITLVAFGAVLLGFPGVRAIGASVLASAGIVSVIAGLAAQSTLGNVIAGIQIAFSDSVRYDDAVIVEGEWGWIEELTLAYVVVRLWDDRRMVLPSTYFTTTPFQNWTRNHSELLGTVDLDLDWRVDTRGMRAEISRVLGASELWDGRVNHFQVTDAVNGFVHVRVLVTARDAPTLFDLRCEVREALVEWLRTHNPEGLPRLRLGDLPHQQVTTVADVRSART